MNQVVAHELHHPVAPAPRVALDTRAAVLVGIVGLPVALVALATGIGSEVPAWAAPWALVGAIGFLLGRRLGGTWACGGALLAMLLGPAPVLGIAGGAMAGFVAARGGRPLLALAAGGVAMLALACVLTLAASGRG